MADDTTLKIVFQDASGNQAEAPGGAAQREQGRRRPPASSPDGTPNPAAPKSPASTVGEAVAGRLINGISAAMQKTPVFGQIAKTLHDIASHTKLLERLKQMGGERAGQLWDKAKGKAGELGGRAIRGFARGFNRSRGGRAADAAARTTIRTGASPTATNAAGGSAARIGTSVAGRGLIAAGAGGGSGGTVAAGGAAGAGASAGTLTAGGGVATGGAGLAAAGGPVGLAIAGVILAVIAAMAVVVVTMKALIAVNEALKRHFVDVTEKLKPFSAAIQAADSRAEIGRLRDDVRAARNLGPALGRFNEAQSRIERSIDRVWRAIEGPMLDNVIPFIEYAANNLEIISKGAEQVSEIVRRFENLKLPITRIQESVNRLLGMKEEERNALPPEMDILGAFNNKPDLSVTWNGVRFAGDDDRAVMGDSEAFTKFENPLPRVGVP